MYLYVTVICLCGFCDYFENWVWCINFFFLKSANSQTSWKVPKVIQNMDAQINKTKYFRLRLYDEVSQERILTFDTPESLIWPQNVPNAFLELLSEQKNQELRHPDITSTTYKRLLVLFSIELG